MATRPDTDEDLMNLAWLTSAELSTVTSAAAGRPVQNPVARATPISYDWGSPATAGLWRVDVRDGQDAQSVSYTYFVKLLRHARLWPLLAQFPDEASREEFIDFFPWRIELEMYQSGIAAVLPPGMRMPVLHYAKYADADHIALWWEFVIERPGPWRPADYQQAAHLLGQLAARRHEGAAVNRELPPIMRDPHPSGSSLRYYTERRVLLGMLPALEDGHIWSHPVVAAGLRRAAYPALPEALLSLGRRIPRILDMLDALPQTHAHGDATPQNLLLPASEPGTVVVIDWGFGSLLPVGFDLGQLLVGLASAGQTDLTELRDIDAVIFSAYLDGLAAEGYEVEPAVVRTGYIGGLAARSALCTLPVEMLAAAAQTEEAEDLFAQRLRLARVLVDMTAEIAT